MLMLFRYVIPILIFLSPIFAQRQAQQYYYTYLDSNGKIVINNLPPDHVKGRGFRLMDVKAGPIKLALTKSQMYQVLRSPEMISLIDQIAEEHSVDTWLVRAVIQVESAFYEKAHSRKGAMGLMQLIPATAKRFDVADPFDPVQNITGGVKYLRWLIDFFDHDYKKVIAAYNAGENAVKKHNGIPPFAETVAYVPKVMRLWESKSVVADPKAKGAMDYLKKGHGGFLVSSNANPQNTSNKTTLNESAKMAEQTIAPPKPLYYWEDANGRVTISDRMPPKDAKNVKEIHGN